MSGIGALGITPGYSTSHRATEYGGEHSTVTARLYGLTDENRPAAIERMRAGDQPASPRDLDNWIAAMHAATKHRAEDIAGLDLIRNLYRSILAKYPSAVARETCLVLTTGNEWFPTAKELTDAAERALERRKAVWRALTAKPPEPPMITDDERAAYSLRDEQQTIRRRLGFVGDVSNLSPSRKAMFDRDREITVEIANLLRKSPP